MHIGEEVVEDLREGSIQKDQNWIEGPGYRVVHTREKQLPLFERGLDRLHTILKSKRHHMDHVNVSTLLHQLGTWGVESKMSSIILRHPMFKVPRSKALALLRRVKSAQELLEMAMEKLNDFEAMHVSNTVWAFASLGQASLHVSFGTSNSYQAMESLLMHAVHIISSFNPQCIALFANSLARLDVMGAREFMPLLAVVAKQQVAAFTPRDTSMFLHALGQLNYEDFVNLLPSLLNRLEARVDEFSDAQEVANITRAFEKLGIHPEGLVSLLEKLERWSIEHMDTFKTYEMATFVRSMIRLRFLPSQAFRERLDAYCVEHQSEFASNEISTLLVACANMGHKPQALLLAIPWKEDYEETEDIPSTTILIIWSLAMLEELTPEWMRWASFYLNKRPLLAFSQTRLIQLAQAIITLRLSHPDLDINDLLSPEIVQVRYLCVSVRCMVKEVAVGKHGALESSTDAQEDSESPEGLFLRHASAGIPL